MIRPDDEPFFSELGEGFPDVARLERRAIRTDQHDLVVAEGGDFLRRGFEPLGKGGADLLVTLEPSERRGFARREKVEISRRLRSFEPTHGEKRLEEARQTASNEIEADRMSEDEDCLAFHVVDFSNALFIGVRMQKDEK